MEARSRKNNFATQVEGQIFWRGKKEHKRIQENKLSTFLDKVSEVLNIISFYWIFLLLNCFSLRVVQQFNHPLSIIAW